MKRSLLPILATALGAVAIAAPANAAPPSRRAR